jgi:uncharacterized protein
MSSSLANQFTGRRYINLESYKNNGEPELTPVQTIEHNGLLYLLTDPRAGKVKRIRENPKVRIVPCSRSGNSIGVWVGGEARILDEEESERVTKVLEAKYGTLSSFLVNLAAGLRGQRLTTIISIRPLP